MKKLTAQQRQKAKRIIEQIARQEGKTVEYVRSQMALAIREGCAVQDVSYPALRKRLRADGQVLSAKPLIESLNGAWQFRKEGEAAWRTVEVPHDWAIEGPFKKDGDENTGKLPWVGVGHYRRTFAAEALQKGRRAFLEFDGVMASPKV